MITIRIQIQPLPCPRSRSNRGCWSAASSSFAALGTRRHSPVGTGPTCTWQAQNPLFRRVLKENKLLCKYKHTSTYNHTQIYTYIYMIYVYTHICISIRISLSIYICICVCWLIFWEHSLQNTRGFGAY